MFRSMRSVYAGGSNGTLYDDADLNFVEQLPATSTGEGLPGGFLLRTNTSGAFVYDVGRGTSTQVCTGAGRSCTCWS